MLTEPLSQLPKPMINTTNNIFLQKIIEMNLYGDEDDETKESPENEKAPSKKSDKTTGDDSTKSIIASSTDDLQESDINPDHDKEDEGNLNTESANERVDAFLDTLDTVSQAPRSPGSQISATTYTVTNNIENDKNSESTSGSESDDERSKSDDERSKSSFRDTDSQASNRGSVSYQNEIDDDSQSEDEDDEEEFFEASEQLGQNQSVPKSPRDGSRLKSNSTLSYHSNRNAQNRWTNMYWFQATQIADYVNHCRFVQQKHSY